ncbi:MAG TPA: LysR family transcriptional regulator [Vicinamibacterales bacterium]|nr:LysR family transcriptional regulator [Vicinamibacterales bacterium]
MDLRQLDIIRVVADTGSFTAAARQLHVSQSAISRQVLLLEEELREPVFLRLGRKVRLTGAGESLLQLSRRVLGDIRDTTASIVDHQHTLSGTIHLAGGMTVCLHVFPSLLKTYRTRHPDVEVKLTTGATPQLVEKLRSGAVDVALLTLPVDGADLVQVPAMREELLLVTPASHPLARKRRVAPRDLDRQACVLFERGSSTRRVIDAMFAREQIQPAIVMETENVEILKALVMAGMGMTIAPYQAIAREVRARQLHCARLEGVTLVRETGWVYVRAPRVPRLVQEMFDALGRTLPRLRLAPGR